MKPIERAVVKEPSIEELVDKVFHDALRGKTVTEEGGRILEWAERRLKPAVRALIQSERRKAAIEELGRMKRRAEQFQDMAHRKVMATTLINIVDRIDELESNSFSAQIVESNKKIRKDFRELESNTEKEK